MASAWRLAARPLVDFVDRRIVSVGAPLKAADLPFAIRQRQLNMVLRDLSLRPGRPFRKPERIDTVGMILFASRAGSSWLGQLLASTGRTNRIAEEMRTKRLEKFAARHGIGDLAECVERIMDAEVVEGFYGFKGGVRSLVPFVYSGAYDQCRGIAKVVLLRRRDVVGQSISIRKAQLTGVWHARGRRHEAQPKVDADEYDYRALLESIRAIGVANATFRQLVDREGLHHIEVCYEDVCADPVREVNRILSLFGREPVDGAQLQAEHRVLRDKTNDAWAIRFSEDIATRASDLRSLEAVGVRLEHVGS